jgi:hypothetical protein
MKTNAFFRLCIIGLLPVIASCTEKNYKMVTQMDSNGTCYREIYAVADSVFLAGDKSHNPFLFVIPPDWQLSFTDTILDQGKDYNVKISKRFQSLGDFPEGLQIDKDVRPLAVPEERLEKHFRWFYTYYSYQGTYANVSGRTPVSIDRYMDKAEQKCWFQGDFSAFTGMNGMEYKDRLDEIETKFLAWWSRNTYEVNFEAVRHFAEQAEDIPYFAELLSVKDTLFSINFKNQSGMIEEKQLQPSAVCGMLDEQFHTFAFSKLFKAQGDSINQYAEDCLKPWETLNSILIEYHLIMPGNVFHTNAGRNNRGTLVWKVDALRIFASEDYILTAESRTTHLWAFILTFLAGILAVFFCFRSLFNALPTSSSRLRNRRREALSTE